MVQDHHIKGYFGENKDLVAPYCKSCDRKAHDKARKEGRCKLTHAEANKLSTASNRRRTIKQKIFATTVAPWVEALTTIAVNTSTGHVAITSRFRTDKRRPLIKREKIIRKEKNFYETVATNIELRIRVTVCKTVNTNIERIAVTSGFKTHNKQPLTIIDI